MRALIFAPHEGIWVHAFPEALVGDALRDQGAELVYITCGGALSSFCVTMASRGLVAASSPRARMAVCRACRGDRDRLRRGFGFPGYDFESALTGRDLLDIQAAVDAARPATIASFEVDGIQVGRAALYEYLIQRKRSRLELDEAEWPDFRPRLANALRSLAAASTILDREHPSHVLVYNSLYSVNAMWRAAAARRGIPSYFLHAGSNLANRLQTMIVGRDSPLVWSRRLVEAWPAYRDTPCTADELSAVTAHFEHLFSGTSVFAYSSAKAAGQVAIRERFGVRADQKLLVASMSSYDEYIAAAAIGEMPEPGTSLFPRQTDWIRALVRWIEGHPDLFLVVRVHPREFPNKREGTKSEHALELEQVLAQLPPNVCVNWPADQLSIYDLAEEADVFLNAWSSAGKEMTLLGLPVVAYCPEMLLYPGDLHYVGTTREAYFAAIDRALADGWSFERMRAAYRWCVLELVRSVVDISDGFDFEETAARTPLRRATHLVMAVPGVRQRWDLLRRPRHLRAGARIAETLRQGHTTLLSSAPRHSTTPEVETASLRSQVRRLMTALYGNLAPEGRGLRARLASVI